MKQKIIMAAVLTSIMASCLSGCGKSTADKETGTPVTQSSSEEMKADGNDEPYKAVLVYLVAADSQDQEMINERFNELTKEQLNMEVTLMPMTFSTWASQLPLMLAGGEQVDLFPMFNESAATYVASDYLVDLSPYLETYLPYVVENIGMEDIMCCSIGEFIYGIPTMKERCMTNSMVFRTDCLDAAGIDPSTIKTYDDITDVYEKVQKIYPDMTMFGGTCSNTSAATPAGQSGAFDGLGHIIGVGVLENYGQTTTVSNFYESAQFLELTEIAREWYLKGFIDKDMATTTDSGEVQMRAGNLFSFMVSGKPNTKQEKDDQTGYDTTVIPMEKTVVTTGSVAAVNYAVGSSSPDPAKALELYNWICETKEANDLLNWGIEGIHWEEQEDGTAYYPEGVDVNNCGYHQNMGYIQPNQFNSHIWSGNPTDVFEQYQASRDQAYVSLAFGFNPDLTGVADQIAAVNEVVSRYIGQITTGSVDPEPAIKEFNEALYDAGLQDIIDEKQIQLDAWLENQN